MRNKKECQYYTNIPTYWQKTDLKEKHTTRIIGYCQDLVFSGTKTECVNFIQTHEHKLNTGYRYLIWKLDNNYIVTYGIN